MRLSPYLPFNGECEAAFKFYEEIFGGKIAAMVPFAGTPMEKAVPPEWTNKIIHASMVVDGQTLMGSDPPPGQYQKTSGFSVCLSTTSAADADRIFGSLAEKGVVTMPIQQTFWAERFGMCTDQFGIPWMVNCEKGS